MCLYTPIHLCLRVCAPVCVCACACAFAFVCVSVQVCMFVSVHACECVKFFQSKLDR